MNAFLTVFFALECIGPVMAEPLVEGGGAAF